MASYILRRLILLPITVFCIVVVNFVVINLAPGEPVSVTEVSEKGDASREEKANGAFDVDERYLQFREHYGLTLPVVYNTWTSISCDNVRNIIHKLITKEESSGKEMSVKKYYVLRTLFGDQSRYVMGHLLSIAEDSSNSYDMRAMAVNFFIRGGTLQAFIGPNITEEQRVANRKIARDNIALRLLVLTSHDTDNDVDIKLLSLRGWYEENRVEYNAIKMFFLETRFARYLSRVAILDFGTLRSDGNKTVVSEVIKRFKYSLTLAVLPMLITFILCQVFGFYMALKQGKWQDLILNIIFLVLYAIPVFVVAPFLIEKVALNHTFPFSNIPIPISGFNSPDNVYADMVSHQRLFDIAQHIYLPLIAILYGGLAVQSRLSRTAVLEVLRQDYVRTAHAKGLSCLRIMVFHVGRNAAITIVTAVAGTLGVVLGGSLIIETIFGIDGFGRFFYQAVISRDYNVIMFSALSSAVLTLVGYFIADIAYTVLDPRVMID